MSKVDGLSDGSVLQAARIRIAGSPAEMVYETDPTFRITGGMIFIADGDDDVAAHPISRIIEITGVRRGQSGAYAL